MGRKAVRPNILQTYNGINKILFFSSYKNINFLEPSVGYAGYKGYICS